MKRNRNIVIKSQFNINGSRGKSVYGFIANYVARESATDKYSGYIPKTTFEYGDGNAFTGNSSAITKKETLYIAEHVNRLHQQGKHAIQQMVISFDHDYLVDQKIIDPDLEIVKKGDYQKNYDDVRLRHAIRTGITAMIEKEKYKDGKFIACIQHDTRHLHAHVCVWEDGPVLGRRHKNEERGVIKASNLTQIALEIDRKLSNTKSKKVVTEKKLTVTKDVNNDLVHYDQIDQNNVLLYLDQFYKLFNQEPIVEQELDDNHNNEREEKNHDLEWIFEM